jgi:hypothetical protein
VAHHPGAKVDDILQLSYLPKLEELSFSPTSTTAFQEVMFPQHGTRLRMPLWRSSRDSSGEENRGFLSSANQELSCALRNIVGRLEKDILALSSLHIRGPGWAYDIWP